MDLEFIPLIGNEAKKYSHEIAELRIIVFHEYPYLYEGTHDYEKKYLETYFNSNHSFILLAKQQGQIIGATTGIWANDEEESFRRPLINHGLDPKEIFYFGESVILKEFRGKGLGKKFFQLREKFAKELGFVKIIAFCAVEREHGHPLCPSDYKSLEGFWSSLGFRKESGLTANYEWKDRDQNKPNLKKMQFWIKRLEETK